ncbi:serine beta-lactamase-like protein lactb, mitochondrial [Plakobranchus ocellatus]|uniref:Serine beta-lactamase-like protein lactb, mitochondrial n=1 Tax=Plakobranchus ocellatus TaxID=259542 RepID=A0AAV4AA46_9GAST|nr:serine beta-lactamase-like protein lactb, mitochondrial [Plakobranchus ocellatus]
MGGSKPSQKENTSKEGKLSELQCFAEDEHQSISLNTAIQKSQIICQRKKVRVVERGFDVSSSFALLTRMAVSNHIGYLFYKFMPDIARDDIARMKGLGRFGYADLENETPIRPNSVLRIASISKSVTAVIVAKLWEDGKIDLNKTVQSYVPHFPEKHYLGEKVDITVSHLLNHTSGIRRYKLKEDPAYACNEQIIKLAETVKVASLSPFYTAGPVARKSQPTHHPEPKTLLGELDNTSEKEMYMKESFSNAIESLKVFQDDRLHCKPVYQFINLVISYYCLILPVSKLISVRFAAPSG